MLPSNHFSQDAIDWANTDIPDDMMYRMLQADERFYEYVRNGELRFKEDRSKNMFIAERMHSGIRSLFDVQKDKVPYATINESDYLESMRSMWRYIVKNPREVAAFNPHFLYSEEVEALKAAIWNSPDRSMRQNELQSFAIMAVNQSEDEDLNDFNLIDELLSYKKEYKQRVRTRKQKSTRRFSKALDVCSKALALWGGAFYCFRMEFGLHIDCDDRFDPHQAVQDRNEFLKHARDSGIFPEQSKYIWFLSDHQQKGFTHHFYILCDPNYVHNPDDMIDRIGRFWSETITNGDGTYFSCEDFVDEKSHLKLGIDVVSATNNYQSQDFIFGLRYMCSREMYWSFYTDIRIETFGSGTFRNKKKVSSNSVLHLMRSPNAVSPPNFEQNMQSHSYGRQSTLAKIVSGIHDNKLPTRHSIKIYLGRETHARQSVSWIPSELNNGFLLVTGQSGSGKTNSVKQICVDLVQSRIPVWVLEPHNEFGGMGLTSILLSDGLESTQGVNPLMQYFADHARRGMHDHARSVVDIVRRSAKNVGRREEEILHQAVEEVYQRMGFSMETLSRECQPPTVASMIDLLQEWLHQDEKKGSKKIIEGCISVLRLLFGHPVFNRTEHFDIEKNLKVNVHFDLSVLSESDRYIVVETLLRQVFNYFSQLGPIPKSPVDDAERFRLFIVIDEAKVLTMTGGDPESSSRMLNILIAEGRKFGIGLVLASQKIDHFSKEVRANAAARLVHKTQDIKEAKYQAELLQIPPSALMSLEGEGDCFFWDGARPYRVKVPQYSDSPRRRLP
jgi:hypothetical protein